jgi:AcrR family transcriptional regulator
MGAGRAVPSRRRDARENRERIIAAARAVFADDGFDVALDAIARRAGVGRATLYRNFADRYELAAAIFAQNLHTLETMAADRRESADAFATILGEVVAQQTECHALVPALLSGSGAPDLSALSRRMTRLLAGPLQRAKARGSVRDDLGVDDALLVLSMISGVVTGKSSMRAQRARAARALDVVWNGIAPQHRSSRGMTRAGKNR